MQVLRRLGVVLALAAPPVVLAALVWPDADPADADADGDAGDGEAFEQPVEDVHTATMEVDGVEYEVTLRPERFGACVEVFGPGGQSSGSCGELEQMRGSGGLSASGGPGGTELVSAGLIDPEVTAVELVLPDETVVEGTVAELPGRPEHAYLVVAHVEDDPFGRPGGAGITLRFLDDEGEVVDETPM